MKTKDSLFEAVRAWLPHVSIFGGLLLGWIAIDPDYLLMHAGFLLYGCLAAWTSIKRKYYADVTLKLLKLIAQLSIIVLALSPYLMNINTFFPLLLIMILDNVFLTTDRVEAGSQTN